MSGETALWVALRLQRQPNLVRLLRRQPPPAGMTELLETLTADRKALEETARRHRCSSAHLRASAEFFVEQLLFSPHATAYRVLGARPADETVLLRRHMVLLAKWLHPDSTRVFEATTAVDRGAFVSRLTRAWEDLKTDERRARYDATARDDDEDLRRAALSDAADAVRAWPIQPRHSIRRDARPDVRTPSLAYHAPQDGLWSHVLRLLRRRP